MKLISWNVNGIRACVKKGFLDYFHEVDADIFCLQETKMQEGQLELELDSYHQYWHSAQKKGYSGIAVFTKEKPNAVVYGIGSGLDIFENEGRVITLEYDDFYLVNVYTPNSQRDLARLEYRMEWEDLFRKYLNQLSQNRPLVICGDLNVAHQEIDLKNPQSNRRNAGFTDEEREKMSKLLNSGFVDTFRYFYPDREEAYTWWSYMGKARERNVGWRIDYFIASDAMVSWLQDVDIHDQVMGSDHCPVELTLQRPSI
ncbi:MAG: exodeoxyribonuclease III [Bacillota bacterium]|nr:exodeoxyribonuclease III [Bacillota bacterium]MDW7676279.1 exodeoxyribonuclease III [Bacillota bacterium]